MNRREALLRLGQGAGALALWQSLPTRSWAALPAVAGWSETDENALTVIGDTFLPNTPDSPGAGSIQVGRFVCVMLTDCHPPAASDDVRKALGELQAQSRSDHGRAFEQLEAKERETTLVSFEKRMVSATANKTGAGTGAVAGFKLMKSLILLGYFTSEPGATQALRYDPVPGAYRGSVAIDSSTRSWVM